MAFCVTFVFTVTLSVFPAVTADVRTAFPGKWGMFHCVWSLLNLTSTFTGCLYTQHNMCLVLHLYVQNVSTPVCCRLILLFLTLLLVILSSERFFISACCFLMFNINDWLGRTITTLIRWVSIWLYYFHKGECLFHISFPGTDSMITS